MGGVTPSKIKKIRNRFSPTENAAAAPAFEATSRAILDLIEEVYIIKNLIIIHFCFRTDPYLEMLLLICFIVINMRPS